MLARVAPDRPGLVGRKELLDDIQRQLAHHGSVALTGPVGIGRSALLEAVVAEVTAAGRPAWHIRPTQTDRTTPYVGLADLLACLSPAELAELPPGQAEAVDLVLRRNSQEQPDPLALRLGTLALIRQATAQGIPLLAIDDLPSLDGPTAQVLEFAVPRAGGGLWLLTAYPVPQPGPLPLDVDAVEISVPPLRPNHMMELLDNHGLPCRSAGRVHAASGGNPRLALAIGTAPSRVTRLCHQMLAGVSGQTRRTLLHIALAENTTLTTLRRAGLSHPDADVAHAQVAGLVQLTEDQQVSIVAGAVARALVNEASDADRTACHRALAAAADDPTQRLWHASRTTFGVNEQLARALAQARVAAKEQGNPARAAELALRAVESMPGGSASAEVVRWLADAAADAAAAGRVDLVRTAIGYLESCHAPRAELARARLAYVDSAGQDLNNLDEVLAKVIVEAEGRPDLLSGAHFRMAMRASLAEGSPMRACVHLRRAVGYATVAGDRVAEVRALTFLARMQRVMGEPAAEETLAQALAIPLAADAIELHNSPRYIAVRHALFDDRLEDARAELVAMLPLAEASGFAEDSTELLRCLAEVEARLGRCAAAVTHAARATALAERAGLSTGTVWYSAAVAELAGGSLTRARGFADSALRASLEEQDHIYITRSLYIQGVIELVGRNAAGALEALRRVREMELAQNARDPSLLRWHGEYAEALIAIGELDEAWQHIAEVRLAAAGLGRAGVLAALDRAEGIYRSAAGDTETAVTVLQRATDAFARLKMPVEQGRCLIALAAAERRRRRWAPARQAQQLAELLFRECGAHPWLALVQSDPVEELHFGLSETETKVVELVGSGASNREIANTLFLSVKTVESMLTRIYRKMGVRSRTQLCAVLAGPSSG